ncbi:MAG: hypothetical protein CVV27_06620 [Candidatus Melainabacteria bacterium HGW-Melainabacteria-1]|nr:MAG: hypothetical protein CVV27_06620 [Candidatus Melainabacteria bacterium HGW-Melainabacteria-1]
MPDDDEPLVIPSDDVLAAAAPQFGMTGPELKNVFLAIESNIDGLNLMSNRIDPAARPSFERNNAGFLRSVGALKTISRALLGVINPGNDSNGQPLSGGAATIARTQSLLTFLMESRRLQQSNSQLAGQLGFSSLNQGMNRLIASLPNQGLQSILNRYIGNNTRPESAEAKQRIADLKMVLDFASGARPLDLEVSRALFELVLDNGADAVKGLGELLPPEARERFQQTLDRIKSRVSGVIQRLGGEGPSFLRGLVNSSPESARQFFRLLTEDGVGKYAATMGFIGNLAKSESALALLGEGGQRNLLALAEFLSLDTIGQGYLHTVLNPSSPAPTRLNALNNLAKDFLKDKFPALSRIELPTFERAAGQVLDRFAQVLGLDAPAAAAILASADNAGDSAGRAAGGLVDEATESIADAAPVASDSPLVRSAAEASENAAETGGQRAAAEAGESLGEAASDVTRVADAAPVAAMPDAPPVSAAGAVTDAAPVSAAGAVIETAADNLSPEAMRLVERQAERLARYNLTAEAEASLMRLLRQNPEQADDVVRALGRLGRESSSQLDTFLKIAAEMEPARALNMVIGEGMGARFLRSVADMVPALQRYGLSIAEIVPKLGKALGKAIPALGAVSSAYDTARLGEIALTGRSGDKVYADPEVRALALLGASTNALDTLLGVTEAFGVGNVAFPVQLGLAVGSLAIDVMVEYFNDNPEAMPDSLRQAIRYTAAATAVAAPFVVPGAGVAATVAIANIYGADGVVDILTDLTRDLGTGAIQGADRLSRLHAQALDQDLGNLAGGVRGVADIIRNPERYAALLGKEVSEVVAEAGQWLAEQAQSGLAAAQEVFDALKEIAQNPGEFAAAVRDQALEVARTIGNSVSEAAGAARDFIVESVQQGWSSLKSGVDSLLDMGAEGLQAAAELGSRLLQAGGEAASQFMEFARDVAQDPGKYGQMLADGLSSAITAGWQATTESVDLVVNLVGQGVAQAGEVLSNLVAAGGRAAEYSLELLRNAPQAAKEAIGRGLNMAFEAGQATVEMVNFVINNPAEAIAAAGDKAAELLSQSRDWLVNSVKDAGQAVDQAFEALERFYTNTSAYLGDLGDRMGAALGRFEDTVVDLVGQGIDVGRAAIQRYGEVLSRRLPELLSAWQDLQQAPIDLMVRIGNASLEAGQQVAAYLADKAEELGSAALEGLKDLGAAGLQQLSNLAEAGGQLASQAIEQLSELGEAGIDELKRLATAGGAVAQQAFDAIAAAAQRGVSSAKTALSSLARSAGEIGQQAVQQLAQMGQWGADQLEALVSAGASQARAALTALSNMGTRGLEALENLAKAGGSYAREAFNLLADKGQAAINQLRDLVTSGSQFAREAFADLVAQGSRAIDALKAIGLNAGSYAKSAIQALGNLGTGAEAAIREIGTTVRQYADEAITALQGMGQAAVDSIQSIANRYTETRDEAIRAFAQIGPTAREAMNSMIDSVWASGEAGVQSLMGMAGDISAVSSRVYRLVSNSLSRGWQRSTIDLIPFNGRETNLRPLTNEIRNLLSQARAAGREAYQQAREMAFRALRDLGVPDFAVALIREVV